MQKPHTHTMSDEVNNFISDPARKYTNGWSLRVATALRHLVFLFVVLLLFLLGSSELLLLLVRFFFLGLSFLLLVEFFTILLGDLSFRFGLNGSSRS